ncbi:hypothetical protein GCM10022384_32630 [Streptomyces marokkonensis]|uniref:Uncharacterized protein n=1 Tax=Streptomyces marokkonensis TaxID=324855 RepID=A0ABP7QGS9_9ACTN
MRHIICLPVPLKSQPAGADIDTSPRRHIWNTRASAIRAVATPKTFDDPRLLLDNDVRQWTELPLWRTHAGVWKVESARAQTRGIGVPPVVGDGDGRLDVASRRRDAGAAPALGRARDHAGEGGRDPGRARSVEGQAPIANGL